MAQRRSSRRPACPTPSTHRVQSKSARRDACCSGSLRNKCERGVCETMPSAKTLKIPKAVSARKTRISRSGSTVQALAIDGMLAADNSPEHEGDQEMQGVRAELRALTRDRRRSRSSSVRSCSLTSGSDMVQPQWPILRSEVFAGVDVVVHVTMRANGAGWSGYLQALEVSGETSAAGDLSLLVAKLLQLLADPIVALALCQIGRKLAGALKRGHDLLDLPNDTVVLLQRWFGIQLAAAMLTTTRPGAGRRTSARGSLLSSASTRCSTKRSREALPRLSMSRGRRSCRPAAIVTATGPVTDFERCARSSRPASVTQARYCGLR